MGFHDLPLIVQLASYHYAPSLLRQEQASRLFGDLTPWYDPTKGEISYEFEDGMQSFETQLIGIVDPVHGVFAWGWEEHQSWPEDQLQAIGDVRAFGRANQVVEFSQGVWDRRDVDPHTLISVARGFCQFDAVVMVPVGEVSVALMLAGVPLPPPRPVEIVRALQTAVGTLPVDHRVSVMELIRDQKLVSDGMDDLVTITLPKALITIGFTDGKIDHIEPVVLDA